jgi:hypothetical protein
MTVGIPKGNLVTLCSLDQSGNFIPVLLGPNGEVITIDSGGAGVHNLLDGVVHPDTVAHSPVRGDLIRGNSTPAWEALALAANGQILSSNGSDLVYQAFKTLFNTGMSGTAFPGASSTGDVFFRTDLGLLCFFDGTRWLTVHQYSSEMAGVTLTVGTTGNFSRTRSDFALWFDRIAITSRVNTTNNASNYWTVKVRSYNPVVSAFIDILTFDTSGDTVATYTDHSAVPTTQNPANYGFEGINAAVTLAPGSINLYMTCFYRLIVT